MNRDQALQILKNLADLSVQRGGVFDNIGNAAVVNTALAVVEQSLNRLQEIEDDMNKPDSEPDDKPEY